MPSTTAGGSFKLIVGSWRRKCSNLLEALPVAGVAGPELTAVAVRFVALAEKHSRVVIR